METTTLKNFIKIYNDSQEFRKRSVNRIKHCNINADMEEHVKALEDFDPEETALELAKIRRENIVCNLPDNISKDEIAKLFENELNNFMQDVENAKSQIIFNEPFADTTAEMIKTYKSVEKNIVRKIKSQAASHQIYHWLVAHRGISTIFAGSLIAYIGDVSRFDTVSKLWQYSGMGVVEMCQDCGKRVIRHDRGAWIEHQADRLEWANEKVKDSSRRMTREQLITKARGYVCTCDNPTTKVQSQKRIAGQLVDYNPDFKRLCYLIGDQFIKQRESPYRKLYDQFRLEYETRPDLIKEMESKKGKGKFKGEIEVKGTAHINAMARRKTVKIFLSHLWEEWREIEGLPTPEPYSFSVLGHHDKIERMRIEYP